MVLSPDIILANRAYLDHTTPPGAEAPPPAGNGGLLAAVRPVIAPWHDGEGTTWIGAGRGEFDRDFTDPAGLERIETVRGPLRHQRLYFDDATWQAHYAAVANGFLWPLLHLVRRPLPDITGYYPVPAAPPPATWSAYERVNAAFADAALRQPRRGTCWVHDYQLALVPALLRKAGFPGRIGFFLHTPFPDLAVARDYLDDAGLGHVTAFVRGILGADLAGFQSEADVARFIEAACKLGVAEPISGGLAVAGRQVRLDAYPVGIDFDETLDVARRGALPPEATAVIDPSLPLVVGLERADFTKGIPERLLAIAESFDAGNAFCYVGVAAPTREGVPAYDNLRQVIQDAAARAQAAAARAGGRFLHLRAAIPWECVIALQREGDIIFTSSLADGMNIVPLQAAVAQSLREPANRGTIITGEDAGVANAFAGYRDDGLVPIDPLDTSAMARLLTEGVSGKLPRVSDRLVAAVRENSAAAWATHFLADLENTPC
ncbi:MAG: trehalose-6-phosphate synthase [Hyphomicrobiales bacterium]